MDPGQPGPNEPAKKPSGAAMRTALKVIAINLLIAVGLLLVVELGYRSFKFATSCTSGDCDKSYWVVENKFRHNVDVGLSQDDALLGYVPSDGQFILGPPESKPFKVTIRGGVRVNEASSPHAAGRRTLVVGDSFTFGDEVSDHETWPACLEEQWNATVVNAGVFGYGAAQAVLRARELEKRHSYDRVIWSILIEHDFQRDRLVARSNIPRPAVIGHNGHLQFSTIDESRRLLERTANKGIAKYAHAFGYLYLTKLTWERGSKLLLPAGTRYDGRWSVAHPDAASRADLMEFAFDQFVTLQTLEKYVLIQYPQNSFAKLPSAHMAEVVAIKKLAAERDLPVIDTLAQLRQAAPNASALYQGHYTPLGNQAVCRAVVASLPAAAAKT